MKRINFIRTLIAAPAVGKIAEKLNKSEPKQEDDPKKLTAKIYFGGKPIECEVDSKIQLSKSFISKKDLIS